MTAIGGLCVSASMSSQAKALFGPGPMRPAPRPCNHIGSIPGTGRALRIHGRTGSIVTLNANAAGGDVPQRALSMRARRWQLERWLDIDFPCAPHCGTTVWLPCPLAGAKGIDRRCPGDSPRRQEATLIDLLPGRTLHPQQFPGCRGKSLRWSSSSTASTLMSVAKQNLDARIRKSMHGPKNNPGRSRGCRCYPIGNHSIRT